MHLPFVPPRVEDGVLYGSGCSDMKGGIAAAVEAMRVLRECGAPQSGGMLLTAHDQHEGPWGDGRQMKALIAAGYLGTGCCCLNTSPTSSRWPAAACSSSRLPSPGDGVPVHEVLRPQGLPDVVAAAAGLVSRFHRENERLRRITHRYTGCDSFFVGFLQGGEIYNQSPLSCEVKGTRRWVTPGHADRAVGEFRRLLDEVAENSGAAVRSQEVFPGDAFEIGLDNPLVTAFQQAHRDVTGAELPVGAKPFVDDGNTFVAKGACPPLTHGPRPPGRTP